MKLTLENAKFAVVRTAFHGGGIVSLHMSAKQAIKRAIRECTPGCMCGCAEVFPILRGREAAQELHSEYKAIAYDTGRDIGEIIPSIHQNRMVGMLTNHYYDPTYLQDLSDVRTGDESPYEYVL